MVTIVPCYMSICDIAAGNVNALLLCGYMYTLLPLLRLMVTLVKGPWLHCYLLLMATMVMCHMSICHHTAAGNVNELLLCGYMYTLLPTVDGANRD